MGVLRGRMAEQGNRAGGPPSPTTIDAGVADMSRGKNKNVYKGQVIRDHQPHIYSVTSKGMEVYYCTETLVLLHVYGTQVFVGRPEISIPWKIESRIVGVNFNLWNGSVLEGLEGLH